MAPAPWGVSALFGRRGGVALRAPELFRAMISPPFQACAGSRHRSCAAVCPPRTGDPRPRPARWPRPPRGLPVPRPASAPRAGEDGGVRGAAVLAGLPALAPAPRLRARRGSGGADAAARLAAAAPPARCSTNSAIASCSSRMSLLRAARRASAAAVVARCWRIWRFSLAPCVLAGLALASVTQSPQAKATSSQFSTSCGGSRHAGWKTRWQ
jgi:hypothetical protein